VLGLLTVLALPPADASAQPPSFDDVVGRARGAVSRYLGEASLLLADEHCNQEAFEAVLDPHFDRVVIQPRGRRRWQAEIALVPTPELASAGYPWTEFRDVLIVDGRPVPDRQDRLSALFLQQSPQPLALERARAMAAQSARFNLGPQRNVNTPSMPLLILHPSNEERFEITRLGE
jgi:hypothetical protein